MSTSLDTPRDFVASGWDRFVQLGNELREYTFTSLNNFKYIQPSPINFEVPVDLSIDYGTFTRPTAPTRPTLPDVAITLPAAPMLEDVETPELSDEPADFNYGGLVYAKPAAPNTAMPERPDTPEPSLVAITIPDAPTLPDIDDPTLYAITLPEVPDLTIPEFEGVRPVRNFDVPAQTFTFAPTAYDTTQIAAIQSKLADMRINGLGLPPHVESAIFDRARGREDVLVLQATQDVADDLSSRGLRQPGGLFRRARERVAAEARQKSAGASRDLSIEVARQNVEAVRFALSTAISLEVSLVQANTANNELALRGAQAGQQFAIDLFNARVALHNSDWEGFKADAAVFESRIRALNSQIDLYKGQVDAQKVIGDVNESLVRALAERLRARGVLIDLYRANIEGARAKGEYNTQLLEQDRLRLQKFGADVDAWAKQQDGYRIAVEAELGNARFHEVMGNVYGRRVEAWATRNRAYFDQGRFTIEAQVQQLERYKAALQGALIDSQTQVAANDTKIRAYATDGSIYGVQAQVAGLEGEFYDRQQRLRVEAATLRVNTLQKSAELTANYALKVIDEQIEVLKAKAQVVAQMASSTMSGMNFGASYSGSMSIGASYGTSYSWSGNTDDSVPPVYTIPGF